MTDRNWTHRAVGFVPLLILALSIWTVATQGFEVFLGYTMMILILTFIIGCFIGLVLQFTDWAKWAWAKWVRCPHGVLGGKQRCPRCIEEEKAQADEERATILRKEHLARMQAEERRLRAEAAQLERVERGRLRALSLRSKEGLLHLSGREFEDHVAELFTKLGYSVKQTPYVNDRGRDAILRKDGHKYVMECKRYDDKNPVGRRALQILVAAKLEEKASRGVFVTTGRFASTAYEYAKANNIELIDGDSLIKLEWQIRPPSGDDDTVDAMCTTCGEVLTFSYSQREHLKSCKNGHAVENNLLNEMLYPSDATKHEE